MSNCQLDPRNLKRNPQGVRPTPIVDPPIITGSTVVQLVTFTYKFITVTLLMLKTAKTNVKHFLV